MRSFTKTVFEKEGKMIAGSRWTLEQVCQAYEKADDLLNYISEYKSFKPVRLSGIDRLHPGFEEGLEARVAQDIPDKAVQSLSLDVLGKLLGKGRDILCFAAWAYKYSPDIFRTVYASSRQAFLKDRFFCKKVPEFSFSPFKNGDNPVIVKDEELSQVCTSLYQDFNHKSYSKDIPPNYIFWLGGIIGSKFSRETSWLQGAICGLIQKRLEKASSIPMVVSKKSNTR